MHRALGCRTFAHMPPRPGILSAHDPLSAGDKPRLPSKRTRDAVALLLSGEVTTVKAAAARVKMRRDSLQKNFAEAHTRAFIVRERARMLQAGTLRATARLLELVDCESHKTSLDAVRLTLGLDGVVVEERRHITADVQVAGWVVDLTPQVAGELVDVTPESTPESRLEAPKESAAEARSFKPSSRWSSSAVPMEPAASRMLPDDADDAEHRGKRR